MSEFNSLSKTQLADWTSKLAAMIDEASAATRQKDDNARLSIAARLRAYVRASPFSLPGTDRLDVLALDAADRLGDSVLKDSVERIRGRTTEFVAIKKQINAVADQAEHDTRQIQLQPARDAVESLTRAWQAVSDLDRVLVEGSDDVLKAKLKPLLELIEKASGEIAAKKATLPD